MSHKPLLRAGLAGILLAATFMNTADAAEIVRDQYGVPHIYGESVPDAFFGYGYAVAHDRLFQLEMRRRQATGQLAEVLGKTVKNSTTGGPVNILALDMQMRRDLDRASLEAQFKSLSANEQALIKGYLSGINTRISEVLSGKDHKGEKVELPQQFHDIWGAKLVDKQQLGHLLKVWTLDDLLAATTNALSSYVSHTTMQDNAKLHALLQKHYPKDYQKIFDTLLWVNDPYAPTTMEDNLKIKHEVKGKVAQGAPNPPLAQGGAQADRSSVVATGVPPEPESAASAVQEPEAAMTSMALLIGKSRTRGPSIQLNGPQPGWFLPSYFYSVGLHAPGYDVVGHAPGGLLAITTGDNGTIAWGSTSAGGDHTMVFKEELSPDKKSYKFQGKFLPVIAPTPKPEVINVRDDKPVMLPIYRTHRGPFITPLDAKDGVYSKQVLWKGHELTSVMAWQRATQAKDWKTFHDEGMKMAMGYNWYYSDKDGHIGWLFGGFFPDQTPEQKAHSRLPAIGDAGDLKGRSFADQLFLYDPPSGYIINWNNKPSAHYDNRDLHIPRWAEGDRTNILMDEMHVLMAKREKSKEPVTEQDVHNLYQSATIQDVNFYHFGPLFRRIDKKKIPAGNKQMQEALDLLQKWEGQRAPDATNNKYYASPAVPIFQEWLNQFVKITVGKVLTDPAFKGDFKDFEGPYTGTLQLPFMKNSVNLSMGTKIALRGLQARFGLRPEDVPAYDVLGKDKNGKDNDPEMLMLDALHLALLNLTTEKDAKGQPNKIWQKPKDMKEWRLAMVPQNFFPENYEAVPTASPNDEKPTLPASANRGAMQRLAIGDGKQMHSVDANPPGASSDPKSPHYQDQLTTYGNWDFKPLPLNQKKTGNGEVIHMPKSKL